MRRWIKSQEHNLGTPLAASSHYVYEGGECRSHDQRGEQVAEQGAEHRQQTLHDPDRQGGRGDPPAQRRGEGQAGEAVQRLAPTARRKSSSASAARFSPAMTRVTRPRASVTVTRVRSGSRLPVPAEHP